MAQHANVFPSVARTASTNSPDIRNDLGTGLVLAINVSAVSATPSVVFTIEGKDIASGKYYTILASAAQTGVTTNPLILRVHPQLTAAANTVAKDMLPAVWRVSATHADADSITYTVSASMVP